MSTLYNRDFYTWTQQQAEALRRLNDRGAVDVDHVAEEIEDLGRAQRNAIEGYMTQILVHLLKLKRSPADEPRQGWIDEVETWRVDLAVRLRQNPGLTPQIAAIFAEAWPTAWKKATIALKRDGIDLGPMPVTCPYALGEVQAEGWLPLRRESR